VAARVSWIAIAGASLLGAATLPQAVQLLQTQQARDFGWTFSILNFLGLALLATRSVVIEEWAFVAINTVTTAFWGLVIAVKVATHVREERVDATDQPAAVDR
jgi:uncharacterized protein with PQ loop repeat